MDTSAQRWSALDHFLRSGGVLLPYPSPLDGAQGRTDYMASVTVLLVLVDVVAEVRRVPDHHVLAADIFPVDEAVDGDRSVRL